MTRTSTVIVVVGIFRAGAGYGVRAIEMKIATVSEMNAFGLIAKTWVGFITAIGVTVGIGITKGFACEVINVNLSECFAADQGSCTAQIGPKPFAKNKRMPP